MCACNIYLSDAPVDIKRKAGYLNSENSVVALRWDNFYAGIALELGRKGAADNENPYF